MLYNAKVQAGTDLFPISAPIPEARMDKASHLGKDHVEPSGINQLEDFDLEIDNIEIKKKNPLKDIEENLIHYTELVRVFKEFRVYNVTLSLKFLEKIQKNNTFSGDDLYLIKRTFDVFYKLNSKMMEFGDLYQFRSSTMAKTFASPEIKLPMVKAHLIWISGNLMVLDHMQEVHRILYQEDGSLRRIIKNTIGDKKIDAEGEKKLKQLTEQINRVVETAENSKFIQQINLVRLISNDLKNALANDQNSLDLLEEIMINRTSIEISQGRREFKLQAFGLNDAIIGFFNKITNFLSGFFGNIAGSIHWRKGYLFENNSALEIATSKLKPMDIILEKSPFVLTDKLIPGHYGHVALYLGTKAQLEEIGMWNHPSIIPYQEEIEKGKTILEAVRPGVRLNTVKDFLNIDELTIVRKIDGLMSPNQISEQITRGLDQMGKSYDFNFDISTLDKIVCSELIYIVFGHVNWPTRYRIGRPTVTPDDIGEVLFQKNTRFKMTDYMVSTQRHKIEMETIGHLADIYEYELRASNGEEIKDPQDPTNSFWKKETKCYMVSEDDPQGPFRNQSVKTRQCKTTYKEYYYEEVGI